MNEIQQAVVRTRQRLITIVQELDRYPRGTFGHRDARINLVSSIEDLIDAKIAEALQKRETP